MKKNNKSPLLFSIQCYEDRQPPALARKTENLSSELINGHTQEKHDSPQRPPPPPPMPNSNGYQNGEYKKTEFTKNHQIPDDTNSNVASNVKKIGTLTRIPTPDYNNRPEIPIQLKKKSLKDDNAEIDSLESYELKSTQNVQPRPPSNYFIKAPNGTATMKKHVRPVSVTIGEYVNNVGRKEPSKLEFLNGDKKDGRRVLDDEPITSRLQSELALTLSRSNLRKKTEALGDGGR